MSYFDTSKSVPERDRSFWLWIFLHYFQIRSFVVLVAWVSFTCHGSYFLRCASGSSAVTVLRAFLLFLEQQKFEYNISAFGPSIAFESSPVQAKGVPLLLKGCNWRQIPLGCAPAHLGSSYSLPVLLLFLLKELLHSLPAWVCNLYEAVLKPIFK